jgi:hypothetical protein
MFQFRQKIMAATVVVLFGQALSNLAEAESISVPNEQLKYGKTGVGPLKAAPVYGDIFHGAHGTLIKMPSKFVSPVHTHSEDYHAVVVAGVVSNGLPGVPDVPLAAGSRWFQKGNEAHVTKCVSSTECVFFITQEDKFDFFPVE